MPGKEELDHTGTQHLGDHFIAEFYSCDPSILNNIDAVSNIMNRAAEISGATIIKPFFHRFSPHGISGIIVVAESHFAIHTWPEHSYAAVDIFSCGTFGYIDALRHISDSLRSGSYSIHRIKRGEMNTNGRDSFLYHEKIAL